MLGGNDEKSGSGIAAGGEAGALRPGSGGGSPIGDDVLSLRGGGGAGMLSSAAARVSASASGVTRLGRRLSGPASATGLTGAGGGRL